VKRNGAFINMGHDFNADIQNLLADLLLLSGNDYPTALNLLAGLLTSNQRETRRLSRILDVSVQTARVVKAKAAELTYQNATTA
jgi:hypothetical protein